jgi:hypothetical protein
VSVTAGTLFHSTKLPLTKLFRAIFWIVSDKGGISAVRFRSFSTFPGLQQGEKNRAKKCRELCEKPESGGE